MSDLERRARGLILAGLSELPAGVQPAEFAGCLLFGRNGESVAALREFTDALRARYRDLPPILAIDQEGGRVARLRRGAEPIPPMMALGAARDLELTERAGEQVAFDLRRAGCTLNLAPVVDLAVDPGNTVIGTRSFGADPTAVAALGLAFARGMRRNGIQACFKHFPGHGATAVDSHEALPVLAIDEATLRDRELVPFAAAAAQAPAIMCAHAVVNAIDSRRPATLSPHAIEELLRGRLGFRGAVLVDCLEMRALAAYTAAEAAAQAVAAGADLLLVSHSLDRAHEAAAGVARAVETERISPARFDAACAAVEGLRRGGSLPLPLRESPPHPDIGREIARRAVTLMRGVPEASPVASCIVSFGGDGAALAREAPALAVLSAPADPGEEDAAALLDELARSGRRPLLLARCAHVHPGQARAIARIIERYPDAVAVSLLEPFDLHGLAPVRHLLAAYGDDAVSLRGLADVLFGSHRAGGVLPVSSPL